METNMTTTTPTPVKTPTTTPKETKPFNPTRPEILPEPKN
jgi:hypothetical protein